MAMPDKVALDLQQRLAKLRGHTTTLDERRRAALEAMRQSTRSTSAPSPACEAAPARPR